MRIVEVTKEHFPAWKRMRQSLYSGLSSGFHDEEMEWLFGSREAACFLALSDAGEAIGLLELSLRNFVDGCIGGPVGYIEGIYLDETHRGKGRGREMIDFAAAWFEERGCVNMAADAEIDNEAAQAFMRSAGFAERWRVVGYTRPVRE